ncbi:MAG: WD40 repeat domain-containing protein, partial [Planctomycetes bacterium]|nr:WD40 repeat domain-containing protein [Planctomycetota bacterium]
AVRGHKDSVYSVAMSPDESLLVTASYDRNVMTWNMETGKVVQTFSGHNDAVYGVAFSPNGQFLATASGDRTVKLWNVASGERLDTFSQPSKEQNTVSFSPQGKWLAAGGSDYRVRIWEISDSGKEGTNPILYTRFAHEGPVLDVAFSPDGKLLASSSQDHRIKIWETKTFTQVAVLERQPDWAAAICFTADSRQLLAGRMNGTLHAYSMQSDWGNAPSTLAGLEETSSFLGSTDNVKENQMTEVEPNDSFSSPMLLKAPARVAGQFVSSDQLHGEDVDYYRFSARKGETWILETNANRSGSLADTRLEVLHSDGTPVLRAVLQAVRDSWINFRPIDSNSSDVRVEFWEEMDLNQYLYMRGEVCKTFRAPRGPDSGYQLYAIGGKRKNYFDTSATSHAKEEPCYIVEAFPPGSKIVDNGLPVFPVFYANDDDADRKLDKDSRLTFTAESDGDYLVRVSDTRGFVGDKHHYTLTIRSPKPDFKLTVNTLNPKVSAGSGQRLKFTVDRIDGFDGDIRIDIAGLPSGFSASSPVVIPSGHVETNSVLLAQSDAVAPTNEGWERVSVLATSTIGDQIVTRSAGTLGEIKLEPPSKIRVRLVPDNVESTSQDGALAMEPGTTITAKIIVDRNGYEGDVKFDVDNLPHGVIVDNIGLSGVLVRANETERQIFLTARPWVEETSRRIHA